MSTPELTLSRTGGEECYDATPPSDSDERQTVVNGMGTTAVDHALPTYDTAWDEPFGKGTWDQRGGV